jgi:hypothetical protein
MGVDPCVGAGSLGGLKARVNIWPTGADPRVARGPAFVTFLGSALIELLLNIIPWGWSFPYQPSFFLVLIHVVKI